MADSTRLVDRLVECPHCGASTIRMNATTASGIPLLRDLDHFERRWIRSSMPLAEYLRRRWTLTAHGAIHFCSGAQVLGHARKGGGRG